jgi:hypothetical protein
MVGVAHGTAQGALLGAVEQQVVELHAQAVVDAVEMRTALRAVAEAVRALAAGVAVGAEAGAGSHLTLSPDTVTAAGGVLVSMGCSGGSGGGECAGVRTALGALLEAVDQQVVGLHAQAAVDEVEMHTALLPVADAVHALAAGAAVGTEAWVDL